MSEDGAGDVLRAAIDKACSLTNPRLSEVDWDAVAAALSSPETTPAPGAIDAGRLAAAMRRVLVPTLDDGDLAIAVPAIAAEYNRLAPETTPAGVLDEARLGAMTLATLREALERIDALDERTGLVIVDFDRAVGSLGSALAVALGRSGSGGGRG